MYFKLYTSSDFSVQFQENRIFRLVFNPYQSLHIKAKLPAGPVFKNGKATSQNVMLGINGTCNITLTL